MQNYIALTNSEIAERISEIIHSKRDREIMRLKLIDGLTLEQTAEVVEMSVPQIQRIVKHYKKLICK